MADLASIVLAAGQSKRMKSAVPKALHLLCGRPLLSHVLAALRPLGPRPQVVVVGVEAAPVRQAVAAPEVAFAVQEEQLGTGHAANCARQALADFSGDVVVTCADIPLVRPETWQQVLAEHRRQQAAGTLVTALSDPTGYGRVIRNDQGLVQRIVEEADCDEQTRALREWNTSLYCFQAQPLFKALSELQPSNQQGEYYLTDVVELLVQSGEKVVAVVAEDPDEVMGINDRVKLARAERIARDRIRQRLMIEGVTMLDPDTTYIDEGVEVGGDTVIYPGALLLGDTQVGERCIIGAHVLIEGSRIGEGTEVKHSSVVRDSVVGKEVQIGPSAHIRDKSTIEDAGRVGTHAEMVRSHLGKGSRDLHFSYLGDAQVGADVNIGAGVITCNFDGKRKHPTIIEDGAFIGSDAVIVAPVTIGREAYVAAGSVITKNVPAQALAVGRSEQENKEGWAKRFR